MNRKKKAPKFGIPSNYENLTVTQEQILSLAENQIGSKGVFGLELKSIALALRISPSLINHYYPKVEILIFDTVSYSYLKTVNKIRDASKYESNPEIVARIWIKEMLDWTSSKPGIAVILEFPRGVLRTGSKSVENSEELLSRFLNVITKYSMSNVAYMCSAVRAMQKNQEFRELSTTKVAALIASDRKFAMYVSLMGFATIGGGLWIAGRRPSDRSNPTWLNMGFNPGKQIQSSIEEFIKLVKGSSG